MKKKLTTKLVLSRETVRQLNGIELENVAGGTTSSAEGSSDRTRCTDPPSSMCTLTVNC
jgi:hypothetical protein